MRRSRVLLLAAAALWTLSPEARVDDTESPPFFRRPRWEPPRAEKTPFTGMRFGLDTGVWHADWGITANDRGRLYRIHGDPMLWLAPRIDMDLFWNMRGSGRIEIGTSEDASIKVLCFHVARPIFETDTSTVDLVAGPTYGAFKSNGFPGDFEAAPGFDVGVESLTPIGDGWDLRFSALLRSMHFEYDPPSTVGAFSQGQVGTTGVVVSMGLSYRF